MNDPRRISPGRHGQYLCEVCDTGIEEKGHTIATFPSGDQFLVCDPHAAECLKNGAVVKKIDD